MAETKSDRIEREYVIPLRIKWKNVPRYKKTNKAIRTIKEFLVRHMKIRDRDLNKIKIDKLLNEFVWFRGIRRPPAKVKVKAIKEGDKVRVELFELTRDLKFKKIRLENRNKKATEAAEKRKSAIEKLREAREHKEESTETTTTEEAEKTQEKDEKQAAIVESVEKMEKETSKKSKHETKMPSQQKHQRRMALQK